MEQQVKRVFLVLVCTLIFPALLSGGGAQEWNPGDTAEGDAWRVGVVRTEMLFDNSGDQNSLIQSYVNELFQSGFPIIDYRLEAPEVVSAKHAAALARESATLEETAFTTARNTDRQQLLGDLRTPGAAARPTEVVGEIASYEQSGEYVRVPIEMGRIEEFQYETVLPEGEIFPYLRTEQFSGYDIIVTSNLEKFSSVFILEVSVRHYWDPESDVTKRFSFTANKLFDAADEIAGFLTAQIGNYQPATLFVEETDADLAVVTLNSEVFHPRDRRLRLLAPGTYTVSVQWNDGTAPAESIIELSQGENFTMVKEQGNTPVPMQLLSVTPYTARLSDENGNETGNVVLLGDGALPGESIIASADGYAPEIVYSGDITNGMQVNLLPVWKEFDSETAFGEQLFYSSLARFIISLPGTVFLSGLVQGNDTLPVNDILFRGMLGINVIFLLDTMGSLVDYYHRTYN